MVKVKALFDMHTIITKNILSTLANVYPKLLEIKNKTISASVVLDAKVSVTESLCGQKRLV